eukprot:CAMPEP_0194031274 /NCGR_PEP_ID=MMETSP0009_2-20130614/4487_1 /TAXON_ID=210454 /ORGANISM="Grammatophora oceanica, Strain CCMP 410" /LENGTH=646 /DNA_ID=CAMNT_0038671395 /DNA_START=148 /DNA_END=2088 /DNA_ORIENTATION=-
MRGSLSVAAAAASLLTQASASASSSAAATDESILNYAIDEDECGLYLADTVDATTGELTMGVFTAADVKSGAVIGVPDLVIPLLDLPVHHDDLHDHEDGGAFWWLWDDHLWDALDVGGLFEGRHVKSAVLGVGSLARGNMQNPNAMLLQSNWDDAGFDRTQDVGAGAFSYHHGAAVLALNDLDAGSEVFFPHSVSFASFEQLTLDEGPRNGMSVNDPRVQEFWRKYDELQAKHGDKLSADRKSQLWGILQETMAGSKAATSRLLPKSWADANVVSEHVRHKGRRSVSWLKENGICMDNLRQGPSTIAQAGRGAFATRSLSKGQVIAPAPLVHVTDGSLLDMHEGEQAKQLLMNYCFGHSESTKLLCPLGASTGFINHSPKPNAVLRWSSKSNESWMDMSVEELGTQIDIGLILEYVALRPIAKDEEITIDYGDEWEAAWEQHKLNWEAPEEDDYVSADAYNEADEADIMRTYDEQLANPYPSSVSTACMYEHINDEETGQYLNVYSFGHEVLVKNYYSVEEDALDYMFLRPCRILDRYEVDPEELGWDENARGPDRHASMHFGYSVEILNMDHTSIDQFLTEPLVVENVPRSAITFVDSAYSTDQSLEIAFRHTMMLPDELFPESWRNKKGGVVNDDELLEVEDGV